MSSEVILFSECGKTSLVDYAKEVLLGRYVISAVVDVRCAAYPSALGDSRDHLNSFRSGKWIVEYVDSLDGTMAINCSDEPEHERSIEFIDADRLRQWYSDKGFSIEPGIYELWYSRDIAAAMATGNDEFGLMPNLIEGRGMFSRQKPLTISINGDKRELLKFYDWFRFEESWLASIGPYHRATLAFSASKGHITSETVPPSNDIKTKEYQAIHEVFEEFWSAGKTGEKKEYIVYWIIKKFKFSQKTAPVIDTICRPEPKRKGGNVKTKPINP